MHIRYKQHLLTVNSFLPPCSSQVISRLLTQTTPRVIGSDRVFGTSVGRNVVHLGRHLEMFLESSSVLRDPEVFGSWKSPEGTLVFKTRKNLEVLEYLTSGAYYLLTYNMMT